MKSDVIVVTNRGDGFQQALEETRKVSAYKGLEGKDSLHLLLFTEEMLSMALERRDSLKHRTLYLC